MVTVVVLINILISLILLYVARQVWRIKQKLGIIADRLNSYERVSHSVLFTAPESIYTGYQEIYNLRQKHQKVKLQIQQIQQILNLVVLGRKIWQRSFWQPDSTSRNKNSSTHQLINQSNFTD
ncbi:hypothetical protein VB713_08400 [Anabaena cylindrica UHCC 0172]|uniref:hypothetical protein n=1 Tax=Anabaena cylindrica TaxID=1165 RepID=UPI002B1EE572|nr:hypothetical protein [Anabaena cylindrica]MEA5550997.1 hypothetical protein [Anabaena cylindrica UHCC 0172]